MLKTLEYRRLEFDLITFFKLIKMKLLLILKLFLNLMKVITHSEVIIENIHVNIISTLLVGKNLFSIVR